eukprot:m.122551 g.122551  ORF g.122551 m.122551 type:complete len:67 (+) comp12939_c1_seq4:646-846(+)
MRGQEEYINDKTQQSLSLHFPPKFDFYLLQRLPLCLRQRQDDPHKAHDADTTKHEKHSTSHIHAQG